MIKLNYPDFWLKRGILSLILIPFSWVYRFLGYLRWLNALPIRLSGFVICVGNMSVGGSGKTQVTKWLALQLKKRNYNFLIVTKAYGGQITGAKIVKGKDSAQYVGDESKLLSCFGPVLAAKSIKSALPFIEQIKPDIIIFDDGMQNPGFIKDYVILVIDSLRNIGNNRIFPAGPLRMNLQNALDQSNIITFTGNKTCDNYNLIQTIATNDKPCFKSTMKINTKIEQGQDYYAFAGISNPESFFRILEENGANIVLKKAFPDHHNYTDIEIKQLQDEANNNNCQLITTHKDFVKINNVSDIEYIDVDLEFENEKQLFNIIDEKIKAHI